MMIFLKKLFQFCLVFLLKTGYLAGFFLEIRKINWGIEVFSIPDCTVSFVPVPNIILPPPMLVTQGYIAAQKHLRLQMCMFLPHYSLKCSQLILIHFLLLQVIVFLRHTWELCAF